MSSTPSATRRGLPLTALAAILTIGTGAIDVATFARLGGVFSSVMTGNLVVFGFGVATASVVLLLSTATAVTGYALGVVSGACITGESRRGGPAWPVRVTITLAVELILLSAFTVGWELAGARPTGGPRLALLALSSMAMGQQSAAMRGLGGREGVSTTYLTGTLTGVVSVLLTPSRPRRGQMRGTAVLAAVAAGAVAGGLLIETVPSALPAVPLAAVAGVITTATIHHHRSPPDG
ncbi:DUF1275 family protein [Microbispora siamensis]